MKNSLILNSSSKRQTFNFGRILSKSLREGDSICLIGDLGTGKTVFSKGIAHGLGVDDRSVVSPTFVLIREYLDGSLPMYHFDLYRLKNETEIGLLGFEEYFYGNGVCVIEWADRLKALRPARNLTVSLSIEGEHTRRLDLKANGDRYRQVLGEIYENTRH